MTTGKSISKRKEFKEKRRKQQQRQRLLVIGIIIGVAVLLAGVLIAPSIRAAMQPVGQIVQITPYPRPDAKGTASGNPNAPVKIDVWEDFQCPACRQYTEDAERQVITNYVATGKVYYVFHNFPFIDSGAITQESHQAANAAMCAADQGRFWDYHDMLFLNWSGENEGAFTDKRLAAFAQALNLDMNAFNSCFRENRFKSQIDADLAAGRAKGVTGTPSLFVNGTEVNPGFVPSYADVSKAVEAALAGTK